MKKKEKKCELYPLKLQKYTLSCQVLKSNVLIVFKTEQKEKRNLLMEFNDHIPHDLVPVSIAKGKSKR